MSAKTLQSYTLSSIVANFFRKFDLIRVLRFATQDAGCAIDVGAEKVDAEKRMHQGTSLQSADNLLYRVFRIAKQCPYEIVEPEKVYGKNVIVRFSCGDS
ncbi:MAG: hypothetical protein K2K79_02045, partial [Paramuribaculum sp.]|nr:hypothetical protein [Paramuribaculum sp.]